MKMTCIGGGPAGLYLGISMKLRDPSHQVTVVERNKPHDTFGWGVVFSDQTLDVLNLNDRISADAIAESFAHWDDIEVHFRNRRIRSGGHGFCGIGRKRLLNILQERCRELGVQLDFEVEVDDDTFDRYRASSDLVVASDGLNSRIRQRFAQDFKPHVDNRKNKFVWLGTKRLFKAFTFIFEELPEGWIWAHAYRFDKDTSTFIVECSQETWTALGFDSMEKEECVAACERIFAPWLEGEQLISNAAHLRGSAIWLNFPRVSCDKWHSDNMVLLGDAAHTAHFSIGSGTKLAFEDAILLADLLHTGKSREEALDDYQQQRSLEVLKLTSAARNSTEWFEHMERNEHLEPEQFTYSLLTRSQRVSHENLRLRDSKWLGEVERWFAQEALAAGWIADNDHSNNNLRPMFVPYRLRDMQLNNRIVVSPMSMYSAKDGVVDDFHLVHYGALAHGGAGLVYTEMTDVSAQGRITPGCAGLWNDVQEAAWKKIVDYVHSHSQARFCLQLGHAGPRGSTRVPWEAEGAADVPLAEGNWSLLAPDAKAFIPGGQVPKAMTRADMQAVCDEFAKAAERAERIGFDMLELHFAHGYLLSSFLTPLQNRRTDEYGGSLENRLRFPLQVFAAVRGLWPAHKPISVRLSATDWVEGGVDAAESVEIARAFSAAGVDIVDVSAGQTSADAEPVYGRMFQTPFAERIRTEAGVPTMAVGNIYDEDHLNSILVSGRADLCCMARPHLANPFWTLNAAARMGHSQQPWPVQYLPGKEQLERLAVRGEASEGTMR